MIDSMDKGTQSPVAKGIKLLAMLVAMLPVPSAIWRLCHVAGFDLGLIGPSLLERPGGPPHALAVLYLVFLSVFTCAAAYLTIGLASAWGEVFPRWLPVIGGRVVSRVSAFLAACAGSVAVTAITWPLVRNVLDVVIDPRHAVLGSFSSAGWRWLFVACYAPLALWGPLLFVVALDYYRRRNWPAAADGGLQ